MITKIMDDNCLVEVYVDYFKSLKKYDCYRIAKSESEGLFGVWIIHNNSNDKYTVLTTDINKYIDGRVKKKISKEKRSTVFLVPILDECKYFSITMLEEIEKYFLYQKSDFYHKEMSDIKKVEAYLS